MNTLKKLAAALAIVGFLPFAALANGDSHSLNLHSAVGNFVKAEVKNGDGDNDKDDNIKIKPPIVIPIPRKSTEGVVTSVSSTGFTLNTKDGKIFTVNTAAAKILTAYGTSIDLAGIIVSDNVMAQGMVNGSQINASLVVVTPQNTHPAKTNGTVTAVSGSTITVQSNHDGVVYPVTINTNASTTVMSNGTATTTAAITVGSKISVKGLWDELLNVLNAIKIRIK